MSAGQTMSCRRLAPDGKTCLDFSYSIEAIYFNAKAYSSAADCLTAAYARRLPLDLCR